MKKQLAEIKETKLKTKKNTVVVEPLPCADSSPLPMAVVIQSTDDGIAPQSPHLPADCSIEVTSTEAVKSSYLSSPQLATLLTSSSVQAQMKQEQPITSSVSLLSTNEFVNINSGSSCIDVKNPPAETTNIKDVLINSGDRSLLFSKR